MRKKAAALAVPGLILLIVWIYLHTVKYTSPIQEISLKSITVAYDTASQAIPYLLFEIMLAVFLPALICFLFIKAGGRTDDSMLLSVGTLIVCFGIGGVYIGLMAPFTIIKWILIFIAIKDPSLAMNLLACGAFLVGSIVAVFTVAGAFQAKSGDENLEKTESDQIEIDYNLKYRSPSGEYFSYGERFKDAKGNYISIGDPYVDEHGKTFHYGVDDHDKRD